MSLSLSCTLIHRFSQVISASPPTLETYIPRGKQPHCAVLLCDVSGVLCPCGILHICPSLGRRCDCCMDKVRAVGVWCGELCRCGVERACPCWVDVATSPHGQGAARSCGGAHCPCDAVHLSVAEQRMVCPHCKGNVPPSLHHLCSLIALFSRCTGQARSSGWSAVVDSSALFSGSLGI